MHTSVVRVGLRKKGDVMTPKEVVEYLLSSVVSRKEIFDGAIDRGLGQGMQIEKWVLIEMIPQLKRLRSRGTIELGESEHKYPIKKTTRFEHCDIWWKKERHEHWLEVKTIVLTNDAPLGSLEDVAKDLDKMNRLKKPFCYHHLSMIFPLREESLTRWGDDLTSVYGQQHLSFESDWKYPLWGDKYLYLALFGFNSV